MTLRDMSREGFADTIARFAHAYATQVEADHEETTREPRQRGIPIERNV